MRVAITSGLRWALLCGGVASCIGEGALPGRKIVDPRPGFPAPDDAKSAPGPQARIIGGSNTEQDRYPFFVSLVDIRGDHTCGGTLVAPDIVLTAGHCEGATRRAHVGRWNRNDDNDNFETISIELPELPHPEYSDDGFINDFMLVKLTSRSTKQFVRLNENSDLPRGDVEDEVTVIGFGNTISGVPSLAKILQEVSLGYIPNPLCEQAKDPRLNLSYQNQIIDSMLCAGDQGEDSCQGDSGGPLIMKRGDATQDVVVGIISWGFGCALESFPGVYSRVSSKIEWLKYNICRMSTAPPEYLNCQRTPTIPPVSIPVTIFIQFDDFPEELSWSIQDEIGVNTFAEAPFGTYTEARSRIRETVYLPGGQRFVFRVEDSFGDGLCCNQPGNYMLSLGAKPNGEILVTGPSKFESGSSHEFDLPNEYVEKSDENLEIAPGQIPLTIVLQLDGQPHEIGWKVDRLGIEVEPIIDIPAGIYKIPGAQIVRTIILEKNELYDFRCYDVSSDGIENGYIKIFLGTADIDDKSKLIHEADGDFKEGFDFSFLATLEQQATEAPLVEGDAYLTLNLYFDLYPGEVALQLRAGNSQVAVQRQDIDNSVIFFRPPRFYSKYVNERVIERIPIPLPREGTSREFTLIVTDSFADGLCCNWNRTEKTGYTLFNGDAGLGDILVDSPFAGVGREVNTFIIEGPPLDIDDSSGTKNPDDMIDIKVTITLDIFPDETGFYIEDLAGYRIADFPPGSYRNLDQLVEEYFTVPAGVYIFVLIDSYGDGINKEGGGAYRIDIMGQEGRPPVVAGDGLFVSQKSQTFALEGKVADYPMTITLTMDDKPEEFGFAIERLDLLDSDALVASSPQGRFTDQGAVISETIMVTEGGLYRLFLEDGGKDGVGSGQIEVVVGGTNANSFNAQSYFIDANGLSARQLKLYAGRLPEEKGGSVLDLRMMFDQFPQEVSIMAGSLF